MSEQLEGRDRARGSGERSEPEPRAELPPRGTPGRAYAAAHKAAALRAYAASGRGMREWCAKQGISTATLCAWRRAWSRGGMEALSPQPRPRRRASGGPHRQYTPEERRAGIEAYQRSGLTQGAFCALWGVSVTTLCRWLKAYRRDGPKGLESPWGGGRRGRKKKPVPEEVRARIVETKTGSPFFGLRRIRDELGRFFGLRVGLHQVRRVVKEEGLETKVVKRRRRGPDKVRRFERSRPGELWQSDITSYVLTRHSQRVYLTVFLDDFSRYVVSWALAVHQRGELVAECLLEGVARFGKPVDVLTDQGRQYFAWRGKSRFQKLLIREGIGHVVSRAHHPETLGKCERLWQTVGRELWERARPQDLDEARRRLGHFFAHYNHFRPHQGIGGLVPADRLFGAESAARDALEGRMDRNALRLALGDPPRHSVFLYGQIGDEQVSVHGERGRLVVQTPGGGRRELAMDELGVKGGDDDGNRASDNSDGRGDREGAGEAPEANALQASAQADRGDAWPVGQCHCGGAGAGTRGNGLDARVLAGQDLKVGGGGAPGGGAHPGVADEPEGGGGHGLRPVASAALAEGTERDADRSGERPSGAPQGADAGPQGTGSRQAADRHPEDAARQRGPGDPDPEAAAEEEGVLQQEEEGEDAVATRPLLRRPRVGRAGGEHDVDPGSIPWWEDAWGAIFDEGERSEERRR